MKTIRRMVVLAAPHWRWLVVAAGLGVVAVGSNIALVAMSAYLISKAAIATGVAEIALVVTAVRVLAIVRTGSLYLERLTTHRTAFRILSDLRVWFFSKVEPLAPARLSGERSGDLLTRAVDDVDALQDFYVRVLTPPLVAAVAVGLTSLAFGIVDLRLGVVLATFLVVTGVVLPLLTRWRSRQPAERSAAARGVLGALVVEEVQGIADLLVLDQADAHRLRLLAAAEAASETRARLARIDTANNAITALLASLAGLVILGIAIPLVTDARLEGVFLAALPLAAIAAFEAVQPLSRSVQLLDVSRASADRLFEIADAAPAAADRSDPLPLPNEQDIAITDLTFRYVEGDPAVFDGFDLRLASGETVALLGPSGVGKSTLIDLLVRFWDYEQGSITLGGADIRDIAATDVRASIGVVPQQVYLFDTTIRENLALADPDADDARLDAVCHLAQLEEWIATLPDGYDTAVGEGGLQLSGGERRRLGIARVLLKDPPIVVFDEATADLDTETEAALWSALGPFLQERSVLLVSHRTVPGVSVDRTIVMRPAGEVVG